MLRVLFIANGLQVFYFTLTRIDSIGFGALLAFLALNGGLENKKVVSLIRLALVGLPLILLPSFAMLSGSGGGLLQILKPSLLAAFYFALIGFIIADPAAAGIRRFFSIRSLRWLGSISYGLYVFHPVCFHIIKHFIKPAGFLPDLVMSFGFTVLVAALSFRYFESPLIRLKERFQPT